MGGASLGSSKQSSRSSSRQTTAGELENYFQSLNALSGGQLGNWAQQGTAQTQYNALTPQQLQAIGGAGATRTAAMNQNLQDQQKQINQNAGMTYAQRNQANQQANNYYNQQVDAINQEVEAAMTGLASQEQMRKYQADLANAGLTAQDLALLSQIYYGGMGQVSESRSKGGSANISGYVWNG